MSRLDDMIQELCPDGVEYRNLEDCCIILDSKRKPITKAKRVAGDFPYYGANGVQDYVNDYLFEGKFVLVGEDGSVLTLSGKPVVNWAEGKIWVNNHAHIISEKEGINLRYLFYYLQTVNITDLVHGNIPKLTGKDFKAIKTPIPPLEVQQEIVRLLDDFTAKTAELQAELNKEYEARKKQYEYYKEVLLYNNENVDKVKIKDIVCKTNKIKWNQTKNTYQYIDLSSVDRETHTLLNTSIIDGNNAPSRAQQIVRIDDVLFGTTRPMLKRICVIPDEYDGQICSTGFCVLRAIDNIVQPKWIYHVLNTAQFYSYVESHQQGTSYPSISDSLVKEYEITLPSLDEQIRIINILDNLEETNFELNNNLSLELESRQKQYEFYRDKLLTFKELNESEVN
ncbi:restriction endonuclease subunit S [Holdemanella porci]|uniref:restriction endonuclease subunit S n=1 Tax=Holdemanella porci TaxID=2652276 RepID=UPI003AF0817B